MKDIAYYNGRLSPIEDMMVPMNDRACYFGDGVYDATGVLNHVPLALDEHIDRLYDSARQVEIRVPMEKQELRRILMNMVSLVDDPAQILYMQITRGVGMRNHLYRYAGEKASVWAFAAPHAFTDVYDSYRVITREDTRFFHCQIKTINLLPSVMAAQAAEEQGCAECIFHRQGRVTECAHSNVHILKAGTLITAPLDNLILPGITRKHILAHCRILGIPVEERPYTLQELMGADEVFFSSSSAFTCRVREVDGIPVGMKDGATFGRIRDAYQEEVRREAGPDALRT